MGACIVKFRHRDIHVVQDQPKGLHFAALSFAVFSNDHVLKAFNSCIDEDVGR